MKSATPCKTTKAKRQPICKHCKKRFRTASSTAIYCTRQCKEKAAAITKRVNYTTKASDSAFMDLLARECTRAGTLQVLQGHTVASLTDLYALYKRHLCVNEYGTAHQWALSHIYPVRGQSDVGMFHASNLVLAPSDWNRSHGTKHFGHGLSIPRSQLQSRHEVHKGDSRKETVTRIIHYLGEDVIAEFAKAVKLQPSQRHKTLTWLHAALDPDIPEHAEHLCRLDGMSSKALTSLKAQLQGNESVGFKLITQEASPFSTFTQELTRFAVIRPDLAPLAEFLGECIRQLNHREPVLVQSNLLPLLFELLHGKELSAVAEGLTPILHQFKTLGKIASSVPSLTQAELVAKPVALVAPTSTVVVLKTFRSFADELDGEVVDYVPRSPGQSTHVDDLPIWSI